MMTCARAQCWRDRIAEGSCWCINADVVLFRNIDTFLTTNIAKNADAMVQPDGPFA